MILMNKIKNMVIVLSVKIEDKSMTLKVIAFTSTMLMVIVLTNMMLKVNVFKSTTLKVTAFINQNLESEEVMEAALQ